MNNKVLKRQVLKQDFYPTYLKALNGFLELTGREFEVLVELCKLQAQYLLLDYSEEQLSTIVFGPTSRKLIRTHLNISPYNLNNILKVLRDKHLILVNEDKSYRLNPQIFVNNTESEYSINYKFNII